METLRRNRLDLNTLAEKSIYDAIQEVEKVGADVRLTEAVILLSKARDLVADFIDNIEIKKDIFSYLIRSETENVIFKNNLVYGYARDEDEAKYLCHVLNNFDDIEFASSPTNLMLYLDGRTLGELKVNQMIAERFVKQISTVLKVKPKAKGTDISDIGWEYE